MHSQFGILTGISDLLVSLHESHSRALFAPLLENWMFHHESVCLFHLCISIISTVTLNCHGMQYNFRVGGFTMSQKWIVLHANFVPWACEWSFHSTTGKKTGVWLQLTSFALLLNWPAREISHWNSVTVNVHYGNERVVRGTYQWPALVAPLKSNSFLLQECLCSWWREGERISCLTMPNITLSQDKHRG